MATRVLGPTGSRRRRRFLFVSLLLVACTALFLAGSAQAVHDLKFQLDGDTTNTAYSSPTPNQGVNYDWNDIFNVTDNAAVPPATDGTETVSNNSANVGSGKTFDAAAFTRDFETNATCPTTSAVGLISTSNHLCTADDTTYATGSKDTLGVGNGGWQCNHDNNVNSKIDIMNAYVVQYTNPADGHKIFYFGVERNVSNGTNDVGVWFLQNGASCTAPSGHINFTGQHQDGDTLVVAEQTSGGGVSTAKAFRWAAAASGPLSGDGGCIDSNDNPNPAIRSADGTFGCNNLPIASGGDCKTASGLDSICGTTNAFCTIPKGKPPATTPPCTLPWNQNVTTKWLTANGSTVGNTIVPPDFFEGGIDITKAFQGKGGTTPSCFTTSVPDTRSSASPTATLFDFTLNQIGGCGGGLTTQQNFGSSSQPIGGDGTISSGTDSATLTITGTPSWGGTLTWYLCGPNVTTCNTHGVNVTSETVSSTDGGTSADTPKSYSTADTSTSTATLTSAAGTGMYCWHAQFVPNDASKAAGVKPQEDDGSGECFSVTPLTPTLTTTAHCYDSSNNQIDSACVVGSTLKDTASLTGTANNPNNDGSGGDTGLYKSINGTTSPADSSITWTLHGPGTGGAANCTASTLIAGAPTPSSVTVSGDNTSYGPVSYTTSASSGVGKYEFAASYDPTAGGTVASPNTTAPTNQVTCDTTGNNGEQVTVIGAATSSSLQGWLPNDRITIGSTAGTKASGTITVTLYYGAFTGDRSGSPTACAPANGAVNEFQDASKTVATSTNSATFVTDNSTFYVGHNPNTGALGGPDTDATHSYFWLIHFVSDQGLTNPPDRCESATITHNDG
ncbi:MAG: hypothetical protein ACTHNB_09920 [Gaiellaceae bacterium]